MGPEDILETDIQPNLPNSAGYQNIVTMIDVFSRYLFAYPTQNATARTIGRCIVDVMTRHAYLPTLILSDKGSQFRSEVVAEITQILEIQISHASNETCTIDWNFGKNTRFNQNCTEHIDRRIRSRWHKYVQIAVMQPNRLYQPPKKTKKDISQIQKILRPQRICSSTQNKLVLLDSQPESRHPVDKVCIPRLHLDRTVCSDKNAFKQQLHNTKNWHEIPTNATQNPNTPLRARTTHA